MNWDEHAVLRWMANGSGVQWRTVKRRLLHRNGRTLEQLTIKKTETSGIDGVTRIESCYFDITDCVDF